jgi:hypothetical protein
MGLPNTQELRNSLGVGEIGNKRGNDTMPERKPINVAVSVLADISLGIYRTPANALKELVSNAFDADATRVVINTGFPYFHTMTCRDDGYGMSPGEFEDIMTKIGGSIKRKGGRQFTEKGRPIIGKIGIGILAVAQICKRFTIISSQRGSDTKFEARVDFTPFATEIAREISLGSEEAQQIGSYELFDGLPEESDAHYTKIILEDIESGFRDRLLEASGPETKISESEYRFVRGDPKALSDFVEWLTTTSVRWISDYNRLLWELGVICPVPYLEDGPIKGHDVIPDIKQTLLDYDFTVKIDGLELRKPILLPTSPEIRNRGEDYEIYDVEFDDVVDERRLAFRGYFYHQRKSVMPPELRGLLVRIRNVAIGMYDKSLLNYPKAQGPRMAGLSGEIYVEEGLEDALNVDRNSFRETDPHYLKLQEVVYTRLGGDKETKTPGIFSDITKRSRERNVARRMKEEMQAREEVLANIEALLGISFEIESCKDESLAPVEVDMDNGRIVIYEGHPIFPRAKAARRLFERILITYELANGIAESRDAVREEFYRLLMGS